MDLTDRFLATRLAPVRQALWDNGEITIAGLRRLDEVLGIDTYNQCDGCARGLSVDNHGNHIGPVSDELQELARTAWRPVSEPPTEADGDELGWVLICTSNGDVTMELHDLVAQEWGYTGTPVKWARIRDVVLIPE